jgi:hypothetical protein
LQPDEHLRLPILPVLLVVQLLEFRHLVLALLVRLAPKNPTTGFVFGVVEGNRRKPALAKEPWQRSGDGNCIAFEGQWYGAPLCLHIHPLFVRSMVFDAVVSV